MSADGRLGLSGGTDGVVRLYDLEAGRMASWFVGHSALARSVAVSPDGRSILSGGQDCRLLLWRASGGGEEPRSLDGHAGLIPSVAFSEDGNRAVSASLDRTVCVWNLESCTTERTIVHEDGVNSVALAADGRRLLTGCYDGFVRLYDAETGVELRRFGGHAGHVYSVAFADGDRAAISAGQDGTVRLFDLDGGAGRVLARCEGPAVLVAPFASGRRIATASFDGTARLLDLGAGEATEAAAPPFRGHGRAVWAVAPAPDGATVASSGEDGAIRLWNAASGEELDRIDLAPSHDFAPAIAFDRTGRWLVAATRRGIVLRFAVEPE